MAMHGNSYTCSWFVSSMHINDNLFPTLYVLQVYQIKEARMSIRTDKFSQIVISNNDDKKK